MHYPQRIGSKGRLQFTSISGFAVIRLHHAFFFLQESRDPIVVAITDFSCNASTQGGDQIRSVSEDDFKICGKYHSLTDLLLAPDIIY